MEGRMGKRTYVIQRAVEPLVEQSPSEGVAETVEHLVTLKPCGMANDAKLWEDFGTFEAEPRKQRKGILAAVTAQIPDDDLPQFFRVLDPSSGAVIPLHLDKPKPRKPPTLRRMVG